MPSMNFIDGINIRAIHHPYRNELTARLNIKLHGLNHILGR